MKKFLSVLCIGICLLGLTACEKPKPVAPDDSADVLERSSVIVDYILTDNPEIYQSLSYQIGVDVKGVNTFAEKGAEFTEYVFNNKIGLPVNGNGFITGVDSWNKATQETGAFVSLNNDAVVQYGTKGDTFIVDIGAKFENRNATLEFVYKDNLNKTLESFAVNVDYTFGEKMQKAGLNTLLGMGTVFIVLILLSLLIGCFGFINKAQAAAENRAKEQERASAPVTETPAVQAEVQDTGDDELAVVIAAAIAAYESERGVSVSDSGGYFVRSIRRRDNNKWNRN